MNPTCPGSSGLYALLEVRCHSFAAGSNGASKFLGNYVRGLLSFTSAELNDRGAKCA